MCEHALQSVSVTVCEIMTHPVKPSSKENGTRPPYSAPLPVLPGFLEVTSVPHLIGQAALKVTGKLIYTLSVLLPSTTAPVFFFHQK